MWAAVLTAKVGFTTLPFVALAVIANVGLTHSFTVSVLLPLIVLVLAGFFTLRSNVARIWRENYEAEVEKNKLLAIERDQQREKKHEALTENATLRNQLLIEQSKTDLSGVASKLDEQRSLLERILDALVRNGRA